MTTSGNVPTSGTQTYNGNVTLNGNLTLRGQEIDFVSPNKVSGTGNLTIDTSTDRAIVLGGSTNNSSALTLTTTDLAAIQDKFLSITIGRTDSNANVNVDATGANFKTATANIQTGNGAINVNGNLSNVGNLNFKSPVSLNGTNREVSAGNGNITFSQNVTGTNTNLTTNASQVNFNSTVNTNSLNVNATQTNLNGNVTTSGNQTYNAATLGNDVTFAGSNLTFNGNLDANTRLLTINAQNNITTKDITSQGQTIKLDSAKGGAINTGNITTGNDNLANGGDLNILTTQTATSAITTGNITTNGKQQGGNVNLVAGRRIETGAIDTSSSAGKGGNVNLDPQSLQVAYINTQGGTQGGDININFNDNNAYTGLFTATSGFNRNGLFTSISTAGGTNGTNGGLINIKHTGTVDLGNGNSRVDNPFVIGSLNTNNGTAGAITTGSVTLSNKPFTDSYTQGNIKILTGAGENPLTKITKSSDVVAAVRAGRNEGSNSIKDQIELDEQTLSEEFGQIGLLGRRKSFAEIQQDVAFLEKEVTKSKTVILYLGYQGFGQTLNSRISLKRSLITSTTRAEDAGLPSVYIPNLGKLVESFQDGVRNRSEEYKKASQELYSAIFTDDLKNQLKGVQNLIIVAGKDLRGIPFSALYDGKEYLVEKYRISIVPSLSLSNFGESKPPSAIASNQVLAVGASEFPKFPKLDPLSNVPNELKLVTQGGKYYLNSDLSIDNIVKIRQQFKQSVLHIATHAIIEPQQIDQAGIYFGNEKLPLQVDTFNKLQLGANSNNKVPPLALMVLSACQSAVDSPKAELGFAGLARSAGVNTVVASLWNVADASTPTLMNKFYEQLRAGSLKSEALQKAQISLLKGKEFSHPFYWATFTLVGNP